VITSAAIGLLLIVAAWVYQLNAVRSGDKAIKPAFALLYAAGVLLLVTDNVMAGHFDLPVIFNILAAAASLAVFFFVRR
jgi:hypothetical protein